MINLSVFDLEINDRSESIILMHCSNYALYRAYTFLVYYNSFSLHVAECNPIESIFTLLFPRLHRDESTSH